MVPTIPNALLPKWTASAAQSCSGASSKVAKTLLGGLVVDAFAGQTALKVHDHDTQNVMVSYCPSPQHPFLIEHLPDSDKPLCAAAFRQTCQPTPKPKQKFPSKEKKPNVGLTPSDPKMTAPYE